MIGLLFGSFNPIHNGHLSIARYLLDHHYCRQVWFVVSPQNPWKADQVLLNEQARLEIVKAAIAGDQRMNACDIEFCMPRPSYTYQTLQRLSQKYPNEKFALVMGGDNLKNFHCWKNYREILFHYPLLVYPRPGIRISENEESSVTVVNAPLTTISSTEIRKKLENLEDISADVPVPALGLILKYYKDR